MNRKLYLTVGVVSILTGIVGLFSSLELFLQYVSRLKDSSHVAICDLSETVTCTANFESSYGSVLGFSNTVLGFVLFTVPVVMGVFLLANVKLPKWVFYGYTVGNFLAVLFITYLQWASFTQLGTLCLFCFSIWVSVIALFWCSLFVSVSVYRDCEFSNVYWGVLASFHMIVVLFAGEFTINAVSEILRLIFG